MNHSAAFKALFTTASIHKGAWFYDQVEKTQHTQTPEIQAMDTLALKMNSVVSNWILQGDLKYQFGQKEKNFSMKSFKIKRDNYKKLAMAVLMEYSIYNTDEGRDQQGFADAFAKTEYEIKPEFYSFSTSGDITTGKDYLIKIILVKKEKTDEEKRAEIQKNVAEALKKRAEAEVEPNPMRICYCGCGTQAEKMLKTASKCGARYVNAEHQNAVWKDHKAKCETCRTYVKK